MDVSENETLQTRLRSSICASKNRSSPNLSSSTYFVCGVSETTLRTRREDAAGQRVSVVRTLWRGVTAVDDGSVLDHPVDSRRGTYLGGNGGDTGTGDPRTVSYARTFGEG